MISTKLCSKIYVRDLGSHKILSEKLGIEKTQKLSDIVFLRKTKDEVKLNHSRKNSLVNLCLVFKYSQKDACSIKLAE